MVIRKAEQGAAEQPSPALGSVLFVFSFSFRVFIVRCLVLVPAIGYSL
jgi:hypothetical protein